MQRTIERLPQYLRKYVVEQKADRYTTRDHAAWRYIMRQSREFFRDNAVPIYLEGLAKTGITFDRIPMVAEMDEKLQRLGWGAVPVCGFIPPAAFLDFQARKVLPIAYDMRSVDHIHYTPAPDIVHEAAGHAPIIADRAYADYLTLYASMAQKAIFSQEDMDVYEAIRALSDIKENPDSSRAMIDAAEAALERANANVKFVSEANKVARMNWWTVEYGLLGSLQSPKIYGAGLLSSVGESQACLSDKVKKLRLTIGCVEQTYDITEPQPQLFVADDIAHLTSVLKEFEGSLAYSRGGRYGLDQALAGRTVTTTVLDTGIEVSGKLAHYDATGETVDFLKYDGPVQIAYQGEELAGQSVKEHAQGFSSPIGRFEGDLEKQGVAEGRRGRLAFGSGFVVEGHLAQILKKSGRVVLMKWQDCKVTRQGKVYFEPAWGDFDMVVGGRVTSVFGGPADRERYGSHDVGQASTSPARQSPFTAVELASFRAFGQARELRAAPNKVAAQTFAENVARDFSEDWLLRLEGIELAKAAGHDVQDLAKSLENDTESKNQDVRWLVRQGLKIAGIAD